jgi:Ca2+-binding RTX toxin-like protein
VTDLWSFDQLLIAATADGAEIDFGAGSILLSGVDAATLDATDFLFAEKPAGQAITGTEGDDVLAGTLGDDQITALAGSDIITNVDNGDTVDGGDGYDFVYAGPQTIDAGFHFTAAGTNVEYVTGNGGDDVIDAARADGFFQSYGHDGNDLLIGGTGEDWMFGGMGTDTAQFSGNYADYNILEDCGGWTGWTALINNTTGEIDWAISVEKLQFADVTVDAPNARPEMVGTSGADAIAAGAERAEIFGLDGDDQLAGGDGNDLITGGLGADTMSGGAGSDVLFIDNADTVDGGAGYDYAWADDTKGPIGLQFNAAGTSIEFVWGGMGNDVIDASGVTLSEFNYGLYVQGMNGDDTMIGSSFSDTFLGGDGVDTMVFAGNRENYTVGAPDQYGNVYVTDIATGAVDGLNGVEMLKFANDAAWAAL